MDGANTGNSYAYGGNVPTYFVDPLGLFTAVIIADNSPNGNGRNEREQAENYVSGDPEGGVVVVITFDEQGNPYVGSETYFAPDSNALDPTTVDVTVLGHGYAPPTRDFLDQWSGISRWSRRLYSDGNALGGATTVNLMLDIIHKTPAFLPPGLAGGGGGQGPGGPKPQRAPCVSLRRVRVCFCFSAHPFWRMPWPLHELLPRRGRAKRGASPAPGLADALGVPVQGLCDLGGEWILDQQFWDLYETDTVYPKGFPVADDCPDR